MWFSVRIHVNAQILHININNKINQEGLGKVLTDDSSDPPNGSFPAPALNGSDSSGSSTLEANGVLPLLELNGSAATALLGWEENRFGSAEPVFELNGSEEAKGSSEENVVEEDCLKKESVANGSEPLKGSPPNGSEQ